MSFDTPPSLQRAEDSMTLEVKVGPPQLATNQGNLVLVTGPDGQVTFPSDNGLYFRDTRLISSWSVFANGIEWDLLNSGNVTHFASRIFLTNAAFSTEDGDIPRHVLGLAIGRTLGGGIHEDLDVTNHGPVAVRFNLEIALRCDFADIFEVKAKHIVRRGKITTRWSPAKAQLRTAYRNRDFARDLSITAHRCDSRPVHVNGRLSFEVKLPPGGTWHTCLLYEPGDGRCRLAAPEQCIEQCLESDVGKRVRAWKESVLRIRTGNEEVYRLFTKAVEDMASLRLPILGTDHMQYVPAAGVPWFVALFGRDSLIASLQSVLVYPDFAGATLEVLAAHQAKSRDDRRDAEPGKIMHELRLGELAHFGAIPHTPYYGTADATALYLILFHAAWKATGDRGLLERHFDTAERCLEWIDHYGDRDGDGFQEYATRSPVGYENQGWKDASEAVVNVDGSLVKGPKALCELQGYVYDAWLRMADICDYLDKSNRANDLRLKATRLMEKFNEAFWDEEFRLLCLCARRRQKKSHDRRLQPRPLPVVGYRAPGAGGTYCVKADAARHAQRLGRPYPVVATRRLQSVFLPERRRMAPRQRPYRTGISPLWFREGSCIADPRGQWSRWFLRSSPNARAVRRHPAHEHELSHPVSRCQRPPGLGGRIDFRVHAGDHRLPTGRTERYALPRSVPSRLASRFDAYRSARWQACLRPETLAARGSVKMGSVERRRRQGATASFRKWIHAEEYARGDNEERRGKKETQPECGEQAARRKRKEARRGSQGIVPCQRFSGGRRSHWR